MDLLSSRPLREGSRGGRSEFSWEAVKNDKDRENYLGHSLMAPVGRWQQGKDLAWYAKDGKLKTQDEERTRRVDEIRKIKEAEEDAIARALGRPVKIRNKEPEEEVSQEEIKRMVGSAGTDDLTEGRGVGFGKTSDFERRSGREWEKTEGQGLQLEMEMESWNRESRPPRVNPGDVRREGSERGDHRAERQYRDSSRERDRHRSRRDRLRSRDRHGRPKHNDGDRQGSRRYRDERGGSPARKRGSISRSRSPERRRNRGDGSRRDFERIRSDRDYDRRRDRSRDRDTLRRHGL